MGFCYYFSGICLLVASLIAYEVLWKNPPPLPDLDLEQWWGSGPKESQDTSIRPFKVEFDHVIIRDLQDRIKHHRKWTPPLENVGFEYGFNTDQLDGWLKYWSQEYPFSEREKFFNQFPQYKTSIQGLDVHFIRVKPEVESNVDVVPLLLLHGWPGSVREFFEAIPILTSVSRDRDFALELVIPSLPGYGFSEATSRPGLGTLEIGVIFRNLMHRLGHKKFYVQGGDWGSIIGSLMATVFPEEVLGFHSNLALSMSPLSTIITLVGSLYPPLLVSSDVADRMYPLKDYYSYMLEETGYLHIQATKPDTLGVALTDSPSGLLAYILEKFSTWTNKDNKKLQTGGLENHYSKEQLIDNIMVYWSTNSITSALRLYSESIPAVFSKKNKNVNNIPTPVPTWALQAKYELGYQPPFLLKFKYPNLLGTTVLDKGGHFIAFELPEIFAKDVLKAVGEFRRWNKNRNTEL